MDSWISQGNCRKQTVLAVASAGVGLVLAGCFRDFQSAGSNELAGFLLGVLLLVIGVAVFLASGTQTIVVDPRARSISVEDATRFGTKKRTIPFKDIASISIGYLGKRSNHVGWYYLILRLRNGEEYPLFAPGRFYAGGSDRSTVASWKQRLEGSVGL